MMIVMGPVTYNVRGVMEQDMKSVLPVMVWDIMNVLVVMEVV